jgi:hypothetical protein
MIRSGEFSQDDILAVLHAVGARRDADNPFTTKH